MSKPNTHTPTLTATLEDARRLAARIHQDDKLGRVIDPYAAIALADLFTKLDQAAQRGNLPTVWKPDPQKKAQLSLKERR